MFYKHSMLFNSKSTLNRDNVCVCGRGEGWELYIRFCMGPNVWCNTVQALYESRCLMQYHTSSARDPISTAVPCWFSKESKVCCSTTWYPPPHPHPQNLSDAPNPADRVVHIPLALAYGSRFVHVHCPFIDRDRGAWANMRKTVWSTNLLRFLCRNHDNVYFGKSIFCWSDAS